jgi:quinolinate synthase
MKRTTLPKILRALETLQDEVIVDEAIRVRAQRAVDAMIAL